MPQPTPAESDPVRLLDGLDKWYNRHQWRNLLEADRLWRALEVLVRSGRLSLDKWHDLVLGLVACGDLPSNTPADRTDAAASSWVAAVQMALGARLAASDPFGKQFGAIIGAEVALADWPSSLPQPPGELPESARRSGREQVWQFWRSFIPSLVHSRAKVPAATYWMDGDAGELRWLELEVVSGGRDVVHHPRDCFAATADPVFKLAMARAWRAARSHHGLKGSYQGRWRLTDHGGLPVKKIAGASACAAAYFGWQHALKGTQPGAIIVLGDLGPEPVSDPVILEPVEGIRAKVGAIVAERSAEIDTIVVPTKSVKEALAGLGDATGRVSIVEYRADGTNRRWTSADA